MVRIKKIEKKKSWQGCEEIAYGNIKMVSLVYKTFWWFSKMVKM
jgi:hypothetical protein